MLKNGADVHIDERARGNGRRRKTPLQRWALQDAIFNSANFSSIATDEHGVIQIFNVGAERMLGYTAADVVNRITPADISDPEELIARASALSVELDTPITTGFEALVFKASRGIEDIYELTYVRKDGSRFPAVVSVTALRDASESIIGYLLIGTDNTARKQVEAAHLAERQRFERALRETNTELRHASRMKSSFLATMSHELRTPLNAIIGFSEALKDGLVGAMTDTQSEYVGDILTSGEHLLALINDILDLSKVEAGMMMLELEPVDMSSLLVNSLSVVRGQAAAQRIRLEIETGDDLGALQLDLRKTKQIVYNLLSNAVKFTAAGGRVNLRARRVPRSVVGTLPGAWPVQDFPLPESNCQEFLEICVGDSGIGISKADMATLFQSFRQIDSTLARKFEGTGLGLAMVKRLADLHGGTVALASAEGEGALFAVWLALPTAAEASGVTVEGTDAVGDLPASPAVLSRPAPNSHRVLVVDEDPRAVEVMAALLPAPGHEVVRAYGGREAITLALRFRPDLIVLDLVMPDVTGFDVIDALGQDPATAHIPVLIVTAQPVTPEELLALHGAAVRIDGIVYKSGFSSSQFVADVARALVPK